MSSRTDRLLNRLWLAVIGATALLVAFYLGGVIGVRRWPYEVLQTLVMTPVVERGGTFEMARQIDYQDDCRISYDRRMQSEVPDAGGALRRQVLPDIVFEHPPWDLDGKLWSITEVVPNDFPCGPARIVDSPQASCNWFQRIFWQQKRPDAVTRFEVSCPVPPPEARSE